MAEIDDVPCRCPYCGKTVTGKWQRNGGMLSDPAYVLVADWLFHAECWDKQYAENPPAANDKTVVELDDDGEATNEWSDA